LTDETNLIQQAQNGDEAALAELLAAHQKRIYHVALRMCGDVYSAEETLQETFLSALKALPTFKGQSKLSTWLYRIASNNCLMRRRKEAGAPATVPVDETDETAEAALTPIQTVDWPVAPEEQLMDDELRQAVEAAVLELPPPLRILFIWRELEGLSTQETADILDLSESAVKVRLHRARSKLRDHLSSYRADSSTG
jgi:RNA polymerase sigma-70 factor (ECF subfamily)